MLRRLSSLTLLRSTSSSSANAGSPHPQQPPPLSPHHHSWVIDQELIAKSLLLLPTAEDGLTIEQRQAFLAKLAKTVGSGGKVWLDYTECMFDLCLFFKLFPPDSLLDEFKWIFWTENELNTRLSALLLGLKLPARHSPDFQLHVVPSALPALQPPVAKRAVIAIDYGSTHSGFAYASTTPPQTIRLPKIATSPAKQPTCVLLDRDLNLVAFGTQAKQWFMRNLAADVLMGKFGSSSGGGSPGNSATRDGGDNGDNTGGDDYLYFENLKLHLLPSASSSSPTGGGGESPRTPRQHSQQQRYCSPMNHPRRKVPMEIVVSRVLQHLKKEALREDALRSMQLDPARDVLWVLTVPAIWTARDKLFMRKCCVLAGLVADVQSRDLVLALEPECSALAAAGQHQQHHAPLTERVVLDPGSKLLTFDCGGGTVDVCLIQVTSSSAHHHNAKFACRQLLRPSGGAWGSLQIDRAFITFLDAFMAGPSTASPSSDGFYQRMSVVNPAVVIEIMEQWERLKLKLTLEDFLQAEQVKPTSGGAFKSLDVSSVMKESSHSLSQLIKHYNNTKEDGAGMRVQAKPDNLLLAAAAAVSSTTKILLPLKLLASFFLPTLDAIVSHCGLLYRNHAEEMSGLQQILLVGGLGSNPYLHFMFERTFPQLRVVRTTPQQSTALVEVGAVKYGLQPSVFQSRKSNVTLGVKSTVESHNNNNSATSSDAALHQENRFYDADSRRYYLRNTFQPFLVAGQDVAWCADDDEGEVVMQQSFRAPSKTSRECKFDIYTCDAAKPVQFVTEPGCRLLCQLLVPVVPGEMAELELRIVMGIERITAQVLRRNGGGGELVVMSKELFDFQSGAQDDADDA